MKNVTQLFSSKGSATKESTDPISMLKEDHKKVKDLFDQFEKATDTRTQMQVANKAIQELKVHAAIEEEIFYPGVEGMVDDEEIMHEATQEHHVVHLLIGELEEGDLESEVFHAKFKVLSENVRHHIKEEEGEMIPKIEAEKSEMQELGGRMAQRKEELMRDPEKLEKGSSKGGNSRGTRSKTTVSRSGNSSRANSSGGRRKSTRSSSSSTSRKKGGRSGRSSSSGRSRSSNKTATT